MLFVAERIAIHSCFMTPLRAGAFMFRENSLNWVHKEDFPPRTQNPVSWRWAQKIVKQVTLSSDFSLPPSHFPNFLAPPKVVFFFFLLWLRIAAIYLIKTSTVRRTASCGSEALSLDFLNRQRHFLINNMSWQTILTCTKETCSQDYRAGRRRFCFTKSASRNLQFSIPCLFFLNHWGRIIYTVSKGLA